MKEICGFLWLSKCWSEYKVNFRMTPPQKKSKIEKDFKCK